MKSSFTGGCGRSTAVVSTSWVNICCDTIIGGTIEVVVAATSIYGIATSTNKA